MRLHRVAAPQQDDTATLNDAGIVTLSRHRHKSPSRKGFRGILILAKTYWISECS
jgi:hypothetical protein